MKIEKVNLPEEITAVVGLKPIQMEKLNHVVLVAGKNGSGKSRLLDLIKEKANNHPDNESIGHNTRRTAQLRVKIDSYEKGRTATFGDDARISQSKYEIDKSDFEESSRELKRSSFFKLYPDKKMNSLFDFVPVKLDLTDSYNLSAAQIKEYSQKIYNIRIQELHLGVISAIDLIQKKWINVQIPGDLNITTEEQLKIEQDYNKLKRYIKLFLNTDLGRSAEGYPEIFGKRIVKWPKNSLTILYGFICPRKQLGRFGHFPG